MAHAKSGQAMRMHREYGEQFPTDSKLPGLAAALNPEFMADILRRHIWGGTAGAVSIDACRIIGLRYRPRIRCVLQYAVTLRDRLSAQSRRQWVTGVLYGQEGRGARLAQRADVPRELQSDGAPSVAFIPELQMLVSLFPYDRKLPHARTLVSGRPASLHAAILGAFGQGTWTIDEWIVEPLRYREHLSLVVRYDIRARQASTGLRETKTFYLKAYPDVAQSRHAYDRLWRLSLYASAHLPDVRIDPPVACLDDLQALLLEGSSGEPLRELLDGGPEEKVMPAVRGAARALAKFNQSAAPVDRNLTAAQYLGSLQRPAALLRCACPHLAAELTTVLTRAAQHIDNTDPHPTHRDMKPEHVLLQGESLAFIDLDSCVAADPLLDVALMLARLAALRTPDNAVPVTQAAAVFREEYFRHVPLSWQRRLRAYYATSLVEVAAGIFHRQEDGWAERATVLVREGAAVIDSAGSTDGHF